jgi:LysM repeat protein
MEEVDLERLVLPALLALLLLGAFVIVATSGGGETATPVTPLPAESAPARPTSAQSAPAQPTSAQPTPAPQSATPPHRFVKVKEGDTPASIAAAAGITTDRLSELNPSIDPSSLHPGQTLKLAP